MNEIVTSPQQTQHLQLCPQVFTVTVDGVTITAGSWVKALSLLSHQASIRQAPLTFEVTGSEAPVAFTMTNSGEITPRTANTSPIATVHLSDWVIQRPDGSQLISFTSASAAFDHIQLVANISKASLPILLVTPYEEKVHTFTPEGSPAGTQELMSQEDLESSLISPSQTSSPAAAVPSGTVEEKSASTSTSSWWRRFFTATSSIETPAFLEPTRNKIIAATAVSALAISIIGGSAAMIASMNTTDTAGISDTALSIPAGYSQEPVWSLPLPEGASVKATSTATAFITDQTLSLYDSSTGDKIRDITLSAPVSTFGEATINGDHALIWRTHNTVYAWTSSIGEKGELITVTLDAGTTLAGTGQEVLALTNGSAAVLTTSGLQDYKIPAGYTAMAATDTGIIAGNLTPTVLTVTQDGQNKQTTLQTPHEGQQLHSWKHAGAITATVWSKDPHATCEETDQRGCTEEVTVAIHSLQDGTLTSSYDMKLEDVANLSWVDGEGDYGALGSYIFDKKTGQQITVLPNGLAAEKIKGHFTMTTDQDGKTMVFPSNHDGYQLTSVLLAENDTAVIVQQGSRVIAYPAN